MNSSLPRTTPPELPSAASSAPRGRFVSLGLRLAVGTMLLIGSASWLVGYHLIENTRDRLIESKSTAARMLVRVFSANVAPALDFGDDEAVRDDLESLRAGGQVVFAAVWKPSASAPLATLGSLPVGGRARPALEESTVVTDDAITLVRPIKAPGGSRLGVATVRFSLAPENARYRAARRNIIVYTSALAMAIALLSIGFVRLQAVGPLNRLLDAVRSLQRGRSARVSVRAHDEIGRLGDAFNSMASAIEDRESRLAAANLRIQELLDHLRQAIVVFGPGGRLDALHSRQAEALFSDVAWGRATVLHLLYPTAPESVEAEALASWIEAVFKAPISEFGTLEALAPKETVLDAGTAGERHLSLDFIPIAEGEMVSRVIMLCDDETDKLRLQRTVQRQELEHSRQIKAMRRLVAGGGQLLVGVLDAIRARLAFCEERIKRGEFELTDLDHMFQRAHSIKGEARAFDLVLLERESALLEEHLADLRLRRKGGHALDSDATLQLGLQVLLTQDAVQDAEDLLVKASPIGNAILDQITVRRQTLGEAVRLAGSRSDELGRVVRELAARPFGESLLYLVEAIPTWAEQMGKRAALTVVGRDVPIPQQLAGVLTSVLTHLGRNSVVHGLESVEERERLGKDPVGNIRFEARRVGNDVEIVAADDGHGLDSRALRQRATADSAGATDVPPQELAFLDGLSTLSQVNDYAGRGVGLGAVREELMAAGYGIRLESSEGVGLRAVVTRNFQPLPDTAAKVSP